MTSVCGAFSGHELLMWPLLFQIPHVIWILFLDNFLIFFVTPPTRSTVKPSKGMPHSVHGAPKLIFEQFS